MFESGSTTKSRNDIKNNNHNKNNNRKELGTLFDDKVGASTLPRCINSQDSSRPPNYEFRHKDNKDGRHVSTKGGTLGDNVQQKMSKGARVDDEHNPEMSTKNLDVSSSEVSQGRDIFSWGSGEFGQHGYTDTKDDVSFNHIAVPVSSLAGRVKLVACGSSHTIIVTVDDEIFAWGNGNSGQLGSTEVSNDGHMVEIQLDPLPPSDVTVSTVACGSRHTMVVMTNGHVYSFGNNFYAQLGYDFRTENYKENQTTPGLLRYLVHNPVTQVACGDKHSMFLFTDRTVSVVGHNSHGQVGDDTRKESPVPKPVDIDVAVVYIASGSNHNLVISENGDVYVWGYSKGCGHRRHDVLTPELKLQGKKAIQVAGGSTHSLALTESGIIYSWGFGADGQLGLGKRHLSTPRPKQVRHPGLRHKVSYIDCREAYSAAVTSAGQLYMWGKNSHVINTSFKSSHSFYEPVMMGEEGGNMAAVHSVYCGAWHAVAMFGQPDRHPEPNKDDSESEESDTEHDMTSESSDALSRTESEAKMTDPDEQDAFGYNGPVETSAPPTAHVTSKTPTRTKSRTLPVTGFIGMPERTQTKLTLGEFYDMSDSSQDKDSPRSEPKPKEPEPEPESKVSAFDPPPVVDQENAPPILVQQPTPVIEEETSDALSNESSPQLQKKRTPSSSPSSATSDVSESSLKKRMAENMKSSSAIQFRRDWSGSRRIRRTNHFAPTLSPKPVTVPGLPVVPSHGHEYTPKILTPRSANTTPNLGERSHTMFISKSTADHFVLPREPSSVCRQSFALVDLNHLRSGTVFDTPENDDAHNRSQGHSNSSSRMDMLSPLAADQELQELMGQKTPKMGQFYGSASDTPSAMSRQLRMLEMLGSAAGMHSPGTMQTLLTPSLGGQAYSKEMMHDMNVQLMRSKTSVFGAHTSRGPGKFYRKPGLPGANARAKQTKMTPRLVNGYTDINGETTSLGHQITQSHVDNSLLNGVTGHSEPLSISHHLPSHAPNTLAPLSSRSLHSAHTYPDHWQAHDGANGTTKKRAVYSSATSWRNRMNTTLGSDLGQDATLLPDGISSTNHQQQPTAGHKNARNPQSAHVRFAPTMGNSPRSVLPASASVKFGLSRTPSMFSDINRDAGTGRQQTAGTESMQLVGQNPGKKQKVYSHRQNINKYQW